MSTRAPAAFYRPYLHAKAMRAENDGTWRVKDADGRVFDEVPLLAGEWLVKEGDTTHTFPDEVAFRSVYDSVPGAVNAYTRKAPAESHRQPLDGSEADAFAKAFLRCSRDGGLLCPADLPLAAQARILSEAAEDPDARQHLVVLRVLRDVAARPIHDPGVQFDIHLFDAITRLIEAGPDDSDEQARKSAVHGFVEDILGGDGDAPSPANIPALVARAAAADGVPPPQWLSMSRSAIAEVRQIRALGERLFRGLTDTPAEDIRLTLHPNAEGDNPLALFVDWLRRTAEERPIERKPDLSNIARGYEFSANRYVRDGIEFLVVEDLMNSYVYAWPSPAAPAPGERFG